MDTIMRVDRLVPISTDNSKRISVRSTVLESFYNCGYKWKYDESEFSNYDVLYVGNQYHRYIQSRLMGKDRYAENMYRERQSIDLVNQLRQIDEYLDGIEFDMMEISYGVMIEYDPYEIYLEGTLDGVKLDYDNKKAIIYDIKTTGSGLKYWMLDNKYQKHLYSYLFRMYNPDWEIESFKYLVFQKGNKVNFEVKEYKPNKEAERDIVEDMIAEYVSALETGEYIAKNGQQCNWCGLKRKGLCPLFSDEVF